MITIKDIEIMINNNNRMIEIIRDDNLHLEQIKQKIERCAHYEKQN